MASFDVFWAVQAFLLDSVLFPEALLSPLNQALCMIKFVRYRRQWKIADMVCGRTVDDSGVDETVTSKFPGSTVTVGAAASGQGDNREIPVEEGGDINKLGQ